MPKENDPVPFRVALEAVITAHAIHQPGTKLDTDGHPIPPEGVDDDRRSGLGSGEQLSQLLQGNQHNGN
jgi:hypothetical protein